MLPFILVIPAYVLKFKQFEDIPPQPLALTLAGLTVGFLALRALEHRKTLFVFPSIAVVMALLTIAWGLGLVAVHTPLKAAAVGVVYLFSSELGHIGWHLINFTQFLIEDSQKLYHTVHLWYAAYRSRKNAKPAPIPDAS